MSSRDVAAPPLVVLRACISQRAGAERSRYVGVCGSYDTRCAGVGPGEAASAGSLVAFENAQPVRPVQYLWTEYL